MIPIALCLVSLAVAAPNPVERAEALASEAVALLPARPDAALERARQALDVTAEFDPTLFVATGRQGELVEDAFLAARAAYRRHRAGLYAAVGRALAAQGRHDAAVRHLRRATLLDGRTGPLAALARELGASGRSWEALDLLLRRDPLSADALGAATELADRLELPSLQAEIDRVRLAAIPDARTVGRGPGPLRLPSRARSSSGEAVGFEGGLTLVYVAPVSCRPCSADLETLRRTAPDGARVMVMSEDPGQDHALRQVVRLYRLEWPVLLGVRASAEWEVPAGAVLVVARDGFSAAIAPPPLARSLPAVVEVLTRRDVTESVPRAAWSGRSVERPAQAVEGQPGLLEAGLAPPEQAPFPAEFDAAVTAFRAGRFGEAARAFERLGASPEGWLLAPEARYDRALCLARDGRGEEARRILLRIGDSRFQDEVDRALESS